MGRPANNSAFRNDLESNRSRFSVFDDFVVADLLSTLIAAHLPSVCYCL